MPRSSGFHPCSWFSRQRRLALGVSLQHLAFLFVGAMGLPGTKVVQLKKGGKASEITDIRKEGVY